MYKFIQKLLYSKFKCKNVCMYVNMYNIKTIYAISEKVKKYISTYNIFASWLKYKKLLLLYIMNFNKEKI